MRRGSHVQNVPHAFAPQRGPVVRTIEPKTTATSAPAQRQGVARVARARQVADRPEQARRGAEVHRVRAGDVEVEDLLHDPHAGLDGRPEENEEDLHDEGDGGHGRQGVEGAVLKRGSGGPLPASR